jgi:hypothetical protein
MSLRFTRTSLRVARGVRGTFHCVGVRSRIRPSQTVTSEAPPKVLRGPKITLKCDCGERRALRYGEQWRCERCGKRWNTRRIPLEEYAAVRRAQLRARRLPLAIALVVLACVVAFLAIGKTLGGLVLLAFAASAYSMFARPLFRRRYRSALAQTPTWKLKPED